MSELATGPDNYLDSRYLDLSSEAEGDWTCICMASVCDWTSWATTKLERQRKEDAHLQQTHPHFYDENGART